MTGTEAAREAIYLKVLIQTVFGWDDKVKLGGQQRVSGSAKEPSIPCKDKTYPTSSQVHNTRRGG